jgi:hypothetical protein
LTVLAIFSESFLEVKATECNQCAFTTELLRATPVISLGREHMRTHPSHVTKGKQGEGEGRGRRGRGRGEST